MMKRQIRIDENNLLDVEISRTISKNNTWYFVHWSKDDIDLEGNYTIYTFRDTFSEKTPIFKSKNWSLVCRIGNLINGVFHKYFNISDSYSLKEPLNIDDFFIDKNEIE